MTPDEIRDLRQRTDMDQSAFGRLLRVGSTLVSFWENGHRTPTELQQVHLHKVRLSVERWEQEQARKRIWKEMALAALAGGLLGLTYFLDKDELPPGTSPPTD